MLSAPATASAVGTNGVLRVKEFISQNRLGPERVLYTSDGGPRMTRRFLASKCSSSVVKCVRYELLPTNKFE